MTEPDGPETEDSPLSGVVLPNMIHRQIMQRLLSGEWKLLSRLGVMAGDGLLKRMNSLGWIERRGVGSRN